MLAIVVMLGLIEEAHGQVRRLHCSRIFLKVDGYNITKTESFKFSQTLSCCEASASWLPLQS
jgi:hypothetical protein